MPYSHLTREYTGHSTKELQDTQERLRQELATIEYWRTLIRARMDLSAAKAAPPTPLAGHITEFVYSIELDLVDELRSMREVTLGGLEGLKVSSLPSLKEHESALTQYESSIQNIYLRVSKELAHRHAK